MNQKESLFSQDDPLMFCSPLRRIAFISLENASFLFIRGQSERADDFQGKPLLRQTERAQPLLEQLVRVAMVAERAT